MKSSVIQRVFILIIVAVTCAILYPFWESIVWAILLSIGLWPIYAKWLKLCGNRSGLAAISFTTIVALIIVLPLIWLASLAISEISTIIKYAQHVMLTNPAPPHWLGDMPFIGDKLITFWQEYVGHPDKVSSALKSIVPHLSSAGAITGAIFTPLVLFTFTIMCLYYGFKDGEGIMHQVHDFGENRFDDWNVLTKRVPAVVRGVIDSIIYLGIGMGIIMGLIYYFAGLPVPVFLGVLSALATLVPFALSIVLVLVFVIAVFKGMFVTGIVIFIIGNVINLMSDSWLRPIVIGRSVRIHFVLMLFGLLGGIEVFGILGIFLGPIFMVLAGALWESSITKKKNIYELS
jgi:predicted PurR-regulated permease PerM